MNYVVFTSVTTARQFASDINRERGNPRVNGTWAGTGKRATAQVGRTNDHGVVRKHPTLNEWAFPDDAIVQALRARVPLPAGATSRELTSDWFRAIG